MFVRIFQSKWWTTPKRLRCSKKLKTTSNAQCACRHINIHTHTQRHWEEPTFCNGMIWCKCCCFFLSFDFSTTSLSSSSLNCPSNTSFSFCIYSIYIRITFISFTCSFARSYTHNIHAHITAFNCSLFAWHGRMFYNRFIIKSIAQTTPATNLVCIATVELDTLIATHSSLTVNSHTIFQFHVAFREFDIIYR